MKADVECFGYNNLLQDFKFIVKIAMDVWWNSRRKESVYKNERFITIHSAFLFLKILLHSWYVEWCLKFVGFLRDITEDDKSNDRIFLEKNGRKEERENEAQGGIYMCGEDKSEIAQTFILC